MDTVLRSRPLGGPVEVPNEAPDASGEWGSQGQGVKDKGGTKQRCTDGPPVTARLASGRRHKGPL